MQPSKYFTTLKKHTDSKIWPLQRVWANSTISLKTKPKSKRNTPISEEVDSNKVQLASRYIAILWLLTLSQQNVWAPHTKKVYFKK